MKSSENKFPPLPYEEWKNTLDTLHMWMQIVGKVKLALCPFINQWWHIAFYVTTSGIRTGSIPYEDEVFEVSFDLIHHKLLMHKSNDQHITLPLEPRTVAEFYNMLMNSLKDINISVSINTLPVEFSDPIAFEKDTIHASYDKEYVYRWWRIMMQLSVIFESFRSSFRGKSSPVNFFWGSFDLNATRFSGRAAPPPGYGGKIMEFAENEENFSFGFWPGDIRFPFPAFYSYLYPAPKGIETAKIKPAGALFDSNLSEFILPYAEVINSSAPENLIMDFLQSTYDESTRLAGWDTKSLEASIPA